MIRLNINFSHLNLIQLKKNTYYFHEKTKKERVLRIITHSHEEFLLIYTIVWTLSGGCCSHFGLISIFLIYNSV